MKWIARDVQGWVMDSIIRKDVGSMVYFFGMAYIAGYNAEHLQIISARYTIV